MREDVLQANQPHQDLLVGLLRERVSNDVKLDDSPPLLQPGSLITGSIWRQQIRLAMLIYQLLVQQNMSRWFFFKKNTSDKNLPLVRA